MNTLISNHLSKAANFLRKGEVVAIPTETVYGLACNGLDNEAVKKVFEIKGRPLYNPLILHISQKEKLNDLVTIVPDWATELITHFWPGPLTLVLPKKKSVPEIVTAGKHTVAVRMPSHPLTRALIDLLDFPLAAPSANLFGRISPTLPQHVYRDLNGKIPFILDGGACKLGVESTIIGLDDAFKPIIYRHGIVTQEQIEEKIGPLKSKLKVQSAPDAPGMLHSHYSPITPSFLVNDLDLVIPSLQAYKVGLVSFASPKIHAEKKVVRILSATSDLSEAAANLYRLMHELDACDLDFILFEKMPDIGLGKAINDKLERASSPINVLLQKIQK